jgi:hypothetical protein
MKFTDLEFYSAGFSLKREDGIQLYFPYTKYDCHTADPNTGKMRLEIKKLGAFTRDYDSIELMNRDSKLLLNKGKA